MRPNLSVDFWQDPRLTALPWLVHGVTGRSGGVSLAPYASLNLGLHVGDSPQAVVENRRRAATALGFPLDAMVCAEQVHGGRAILVTAVDAGRGARDYATALPDVDALVTATPGVLPTLFFADCVPVFLVDPKARAVAVAHAGWRGLTSGILGNTVAAMEASFGSAPTDLLTAVGPCIGACCYVVGEEVAAHFSDDLLRRSPEGRPHLDLARAAARELERAGVACGRITLSGQCNACLAERYFSHRRDRGRTGRIGALIGIRP